MSIPACFRHCLASPSAFLVGLNCITSSDLGHLPAASSLPSFSPSSPLHFAVSLLSRFSWHILYFAQAKTDTMAGFYMQYLESKSPTRQPLLSNLAFQFNHKNPTLPILLWGVVTRHGISPFGMVYPCMRFPQHGDVPPLSSSRDRTPGVILPPRYPQIKPTPVIGLRHPCSAATQSGNPSAHVSCFTHIHSDEESR